MQRQIPSRTYVPQRTILIRSRESMIVPKRAGAPLVISQRELTSRLNYDWRPQTRTQLLVALQQPAPPAVPAAVQEVTEPAVTTFAASVPRKKMALLLPGHNEELIIVATIQSAVAAGQDLEDIYVVDDASDDATPALAKELLGEDHVLSVERSGKAGAVQKAIAFFDLAARYEW